jgi:hypothetical protein
MAIIQPSLVFEGSDLGVRRDPQPGDYTARFQNVQFTDDKKSKILLEWRLTNHPMTCYTWEAKHTCTLDPKFIKFLNGHLWWWKRKKWARLGASDDERLAMMRTWIEDEANIRVYSWNSANPTLVSVDQVWSIGMPYHPREYEYTD